MDLQKSTDEMLDEICRLVYEKLYGTGAKGLEPFIEGISEELKERNIQHVTSKKSLDKHRDKYFKIDVMIPPLERFIMLKYRKHVTRADMNQFKQQESSIGVKGLMVNFYNGVDVHTANSLLPGEEKREMMKKNGKLRGLAAGKSTTVDKLPGITNRRYRPSRSWGGSSKVASGTAGEASATKMPTSPVAVNIDYNRIFAASCASFFISDGDRITFASAFNDFLSQMSIKRLTFPRKLLHGHTLQRPDGVLRENLESFFESSSIASTVRRKTPDEEDYLDSKPGSGYSDTRDSDITSSRFRKLPAIGSVTPSPPDNYNPSFRVAAIAPSNKRPVTIDLPRAYAAACAAFFFSSGDNEEFFYDFTDMIKSLNIGNQYGMKYSYYSKYKRGGDEEVEENVDDLKMPPKKVLLLLKIMLIGEDKVNEEEEEKEEEEENEEEVQNGEVEGEEKERNLVNGNHEDENNESNDAKHNDEAEKDQEKRLEEEEREEDEKEPENNNNETTNDVS